MKQLNKFLLNNFALSVLTNILFLSLVIYSAQVIERVIGSGNILTLKLLFVIVITVLSICTYIHRRITNNCAAYCQSSPKIFLDEINNSRLSKANILKKIFLHTKIYHAFDIMCLPLFLAYLLWFDYIIFIIICLSQIILIFLSALTSSKNHLKSDYNKESVTWEMGDWLYYPKILVTLVIHIFSKAVIIYNNCFYIIKSIINFSNDNGGLKPIALGIIRGACYFIIYYTVLGYTLYTVISQSHYPDSTDLLIVAVISTKIFFDTENICRVIQK